MLTEKLPMVLVITGNLEDDEPRRLENTFREWPHGAGGFSTYQSYER